ncbi:MAG: ABC transporter substrate-binding protein [Colwellia sp.]|nr:ABC transporter substrate-binding protein [Colwellia sp.]
MQNQFQPLLILIFCILFSTQCLSKNININVLVEDGYFPMIINAENRQGFAFEFIQILNESQQEYRFILNVLPSKRLIKMVDEKNFDALFFMAIDWLPKSAHSSLTKTSTSVIIKNEFYTLKENAIEQSYFDNFDDLTKAGVLGYSYKFADYNTDASFLNNVHKMSLTQSGSHVAQMILLKRVEVGIINNLTFQYLKQTNNFDMDLFYKSNTPDGIFDTSFLINQHSTKFTANKFDQIIKSFKTKKRLQQLFTQYGIHSNVNQW